MKIDVTLVACRRPDLLKRTLASFATNVFAHFEIAGAYCNIDPPYGDEGHAAACRALIETYLPNALVTEPDAGSFGRAVRTVWSQTTADVVLHMEDDWTLREAITPERVAATLAGRTASLTPVSRYHKSKPGQAFATRRRTIVALGPMRIRRRVPDFGTSPMFVRGDFIRRYAAMLNVDLDPEKQCRPGENVPLHRFASSHRHAFLWGQDGTFPIEDIGRDWREARGIEKVHEDGGVAWVERTADRP